MVDTSTEAVEWLAKRIRASCGCAFGANAEQPVAETLRALLAERDTLKKERDEAIEGWHVIHPNITVQDAAETDAERFDRADWFWRVMDPDDSADTPAEAIHRGMIGDYCVCEIASSYTGPVRFGFNAPVLDPESDDTEFSHFATQQEAIDAAKARSAALRAITEVKA